MKEYIPSIHLKRLRDGVGLDDGFPGYGKVFFEADER